MSTQRLAELFQQLEESKITKQHWKIITAGFLGCMLEFFDFFIIGFILAFIVGPWKLNFAQSSALLMSAGVGAAIGSVMWGWAGDRLGRRPIFILTILNFSIPTGIMYFTPEGGWLFLTIFRFLVGLGVGGLYPVDISILQEYVPGRIRGRIGGLVGVFIGLGIVAGSLSSAYLTSIIGWRGLFLVGLAPALFTLLIRVWVPESPRWLISKGRYAEAEKSLLWVLGKNQPLTAQPLVGNPSASGEALAFLESSPQVRWLELFKYPRSVVVSFGAQFTVQTAYYGFTLWAPTILSLVLNIKPAQAAKMYFYIGITGIVGRVVFSFLSDWIGRRWSGFLMGMAGGVFIIMAGFNHSVFVGSFSLMVILLIIFYFFFDGGFAVLSPYCTEVWPKHLRASGVGAAYGFGGLGKFIGPAILAAFAGSANIVLPKATINAIVPTFIFFGILGMIAGILFLFGYEPKGKSIEEIDAMVRK